MSEGTAKDEVQRLLNILFSSAEAKVLTAAIERMVEEKVEKMVQGGSAMTNMTLAEYLAITPPAIANAADTCLGVGKPPYPTEESGSFDVSPSAIDWKDYNEEHPAHPF